MVDDMILKTLSLALSENKAVILMYQGKNDITLRRVYVRSIKEDKLTAYCTQKHALRVFKISQILSAVFAEEVN